MPAPDPLRCVSVHSVKGGVGKSSIAWSIARRLAQDGPTLLVDLDLTGTSLADVLPILAPAHDPTDAAAMRERPQRFDDRLASQRRIDGRRVEPGEGPAVVPFLNDFLLFDEDRFDLRNDVHPLAVAWATDLPDLLVAPSSALPRDLHAAMPVIYDEWNAGFFEGRLEWLLEYLLLKTDVRRVVFDAPPTIPGLSACLLSLAMRLPEHTHLVPRSPARSPRTLFSTTVDWTPLLIVSPDHQDLRAAERWLLGKPQHELSRIRTVLNGASSAEVNRLRRVLWEWADEQEDAPDAPPDETALLAAERLWTVAWMEGWSPFRPGTRHRDDEAVSSGLADLLERLAGGSAT